MVPGSGPRRPSRRVVRADHLQLECCRIMAMRRHDAQRLQRALGADVILAGGFRKPGIPASALFLPHSWRRLDRDFRIPSWKIGSCGREESLRDLRFADDLEPALEKAGDLNRPRPSVSVRTVFCPPRRNRNSRCSLPSLSA